MQEEADEDFSTKRQESQEMRVYNALMAQSTELSADLGVITHIYGKITLSHDYKELANKTNQLRQVVESRYKEVQAKIAQWDQHFKQQQAYAEVLKQEEIINLMCDKYL